MSSAPAVLRSNLVHLLLNQLMLALQEKRSWKESVTIALADVSLFVWEILLVFDMLIAGQGLHHFREGE